MTPKERMIQALSLQQPDRVPAAPIYLGLYLADDFNQSYTQEYEKELGGFDRYSINHKQDTIFRVKAISMAYKNTLKQMPDWIFTKPGLTRKWASDLDIQTQNSHLYYFDKRCGKILGTFPYSPSVTDYIIKKKHFQSSEQDIWDNSKHLDSVKAVDEILEFVPKEKLEQQGVGKLPRCTVREFGDDYFVYFVVTTPFTYLYRLFGFRGMMVKLHQEPELAKYAIDKISHQALELIQLFADAGVDGVFLEEYYTSADIISPQAYSEFVYSSDQKFIENIRNTGLKVVLYVCGDVMPRVEQIATLGADALAFEGSKKNFEVDLRKVIDLVGEGRCIFENIDSIRFGSKGNEDEMVEEVCKQISMGMRAGGFMVSNGSPFPLETDPHQIDTLIRTAHEHVP